MQEVDHLQRLLVIAFSTVFIIVFALAMGAHHFRKKKRLIVASAREEDPRIGWVAGDYFMFLNSLIRSCRTLDELQATMPKIEGYYDKGYQQPTVNNITPSNKYAKGV